MKMSLRQQNETEKRGVAKYECGECGDMELVLSHVDERGNDIYKPCQCRARKAWRRRFKNALIPDEFQKATLENYRKDSGIQKEMHQLTLDYLSKFPTSPKDLKGMGNFGLIATFGEQRIRSMPDNVRAEVKVKHNNFGIGKTHLQIALSKLLIKQGFSVLVISDVEFTDEMMNARRMNDENEIFNRLMNGVLSADVLVWDDIGKARPTEAKESLYYNIINERYKRRKPIVFNSNEDRGTLADRIGYAASSRLIGTCYEEETEKDYLLETEGEDQRLRKSKRKQEEIK